MTKKYMWVWVGVLLGVMVLQWAGPTFAKQDKEKEDRGPLSRITFIHYRKGHAKPSWAGGGKDKEDSGSYTYLANGAKWRVVENLRLNPVYAANPDGRLDGLVEGAANAAVAEWETAGGKSLPIFGSVSIDESVGYDDGAYREYNTISFGPYGDARVIAVTTVWGYFYGKPSTREIVEAHILMNDAYQWGDAEADSSLMDVQNIFTHELGHWAGMGDLYETTATEETMYGYSTEGETKKRDLYKGDITGITGLYK